MAATIKIIGAGVSSANGIFLPQAASIIPAGFAKVCEQNLWDVKNTWNTLTDLSTPWYLKNDGAYIYYNKSDGHWWIDAPQGHGLYVAKIQNKGAKLPPFKGWKVLNNDYAPLPTLELVKEEQ